MSAHNISRREFFEKTTKAGIMIGFAGGFSQGQVYSPVKHYDLIIKNGLIVDGSNSKPFESDLGIVAERIETL